MITNNQEFPTDSVVSFFPNKFFTRWGKFSQYPKNTQTDYWDTMSNISFFTAKTVLSSKNQSLPPPSMNLAINQNTKAKLNDTAKLDMHHIARAASISRETIRCMYKEFLNKAVELAKITTVYINYKCGTIKISSSDLQWIGCNINEINPRSSNLFDDAISLALSSQSGNFNVLGNYTPAGCKSATPKCRSEHHH